MRWIKFNKNQNPNGRWKLMPPSIRTINVWLNINKIFVHKHSWHIVHLSSSRHRHRFHRLFPFFVLNIYETIKSIIAFSWCRLWSLFEKNKHSRWRTAQPSRVWDRVHRYCIFQYIYIIIRSVWPKNRVIHLIDPSNILSTIDIC